MEKYNDWTVIGDITVKKSKKYILCECACGKKKDVLYSNLKNGKSKRCSSCAGKLITLPQGFKNTWIGSSIGNLNRTMFGHIRSKASERDLEFNISQQFLWDLLVKQNHKCALSGINIFLSKKIKNGNPDFNFITASLDRINSDIGYIESNVQWVHKDVNKMKMQYNNNYFINICKLVSKYHDNTDLSINLND